MSDKYLTLDNDGNITRKDSVVIGGTTDEAGRIVGLNQQGKLDASIMPVELDVRVRYIRVFETLTAGDFVNIFELNGELNIRKAIATSINYKADGFVLEDYFMGNMAKVFLEGENNKVSEQVYGQTFLSATIAGKATNIYPERNGSNILQRLGLCLAPTIINFKNYEPIIL